MPQDDDLRSLKEQMKAMERRLAAMGSNRADCMISGIGKTEAIGTYPTNAGGCYGLNIQQISGNETENTLATYTDTGIVIRAFNIGSRVPPAGTRVLYKQESNTNRTVFNY